MRKRATLDERSNPLSHSSWHEKLLHFEARFQKPRNEKINPIRRLSNAIHAATLSKDDPEKHTRDENRAQDQGEENNNEKTTKKRKLFGVASPACRQLAGVEDWARERKQQELSAQQKKKAERDEWLATRFKRFSLALFAGLALIGPMILMTLVGRLACSLATTSVATLFFALLITYFTQASDRDIV